MRKLHLIGLTLALAACGDNDKSTTITTAEGEKIDIKHSGDASAETGSVTVTNDKGESATFSAGEAASKNLPLGVPVYPGATVKGNISGSSDKGGGAMVMMSTSDTADKVTAFYKAEAEKRGMTVKSGDSIMGAISSFTAENEEGEKLVATVTPGGSENQIMLVIETK